MNWLIIESNNKYERDVSTYSQYNQINRHEKDSARSQNESIGLGKNVLSSWFLMGAKRLKGVFQISNKSDVKA
jgi:hypothetical protein